MAERILPVSVDMLSTLDMRIDALKDLVTQLRQGDFTGQVTPSEHDDALDQIIHGMNQMAGSLLQRQQADHELEQRGSELLDVMMSVAALDYSKRVPLGDGDGIFDALAAGLNMLVDELVAAQETQVRLQNEIIQAQAAAIQELSTPLIPISEHVVVMPLIGSIDSSRAQQVIERLLTGISENRADTVILDITGVPIVDTQVANALIRAAQAVRLLGAQIVLTGIRPEVAQTLVGLGIDLRNIVTHSTLQTAIVYAMNGNSASKS